MKTGMKMVMARTIRLAVMTLCVAVATGHAAAQAADAGTPARLLVVTVTTGFRHGSINTAEPVLEQLGRERGLYHLDYLRMPEGRPSQPKSPKRAEGVSDADWQQQESAFKAQQDPDLVEVMAPRPEWDAPLWIVTHVDLHRTRKVQAFLTVLKDSAKSWSV
mgnify:CR=1 FL=1